MSAHMSRRMSAPVRDDGLVRLVHEERHRVDEVSEHDGAEQHAHAAVCPLPVCHRHDVAVPDGC